MTEPLGIDASAMVDLVTVGLPASAVGRRLQGCELHAPAHFDAEVLSALGMLNRAGGLSDAEGAHRLDVVAAASIERHGLPLLLRGAWERRRALRVADALYVELAELLSAVLVTTDAALARADGNAEVPAP